MLQAQVNYWNLIEQQRHNLVTESNDTFNAMTQRMNVEEVSRHNKVTEELGFQTLAETSRHNRVTEEQGYQNIQIARDTLIENIRSHKANESIGWANVGVGQANVSVNQANANTNRLQALVQEQNVQNQYTLGKYKNYTERMNAYSNQQKANADTSNAKVNITNATTREKEYNLKEADTKVNWFTSLFDAASKITTRRR